MTSIRRSWLHLATGAGLGRIFGFVSNLMLSRWLGPFDLGLFNLIATSIQTGDTLLRLGSDYAINYEIGGDHGALLTKQGLGKLSAFVQICTMGTLILFMAGGVWFFYNEGLLAPDPSHSYRFELGILILSLFLIDGVCASAWEILLVSKRTRSLALRQGLFYPLRLFAAATISLKFGIIGALTAWFCVSLAQYAWLRVTLKSLWNPFRVFPFQLDWIPQLLKRGLPFYASNLLSSIISYLLLLDVAESTGLVQIGYLRIAQILQQLFAFLPATLVPILFLHLRSQISLENKVYFLERPIRIVWLASLTFLFCYCIVDRPLILLLFGKDYIPSIIPTRLFLLIALLECLSQLIVQPILASGKIQLYSLAQNISAIVSGILGWYTIPQYGLAAYILMRFVYVALPFICFSIALLSKLNNPVSFYTIGVATLLIAILFFIQQLSPTFFQLPWWSFSFGITTLLWIYRSDAKYLVSQVTSINR